jgi:hypothetical protein
VAKAANFHKPLARAQQIGDRSSIAGVFFRFTVGFEILGDSLGLVGNSLGVDSGGRFGF